MDELKEILQNMLFLLEEYVPGECLENGVQYQGMDEGVVRSSEMIAEAKDILRAHMSRREIEESPIF